MRRDVTVRSLKNLQHEVLIGKHKVIADEPSELGGDDAGPSPQMLLVGALGA